jgi:golgi phosphoprotein 3
MFTLAEEFFLLSIDDAKGKIITAVDDGLQIGLAGALLADLALHGKINLADKRLAVIDPTLTGEPLLDEALARLGDEKKLRKTGYWVEKLATKKLPKRVAARLVEQNVLQIEEKRYLWVIPYDVFPQVDASAKYWVKEHLRSAVLASSEVTPGIVVLLSLLKACRLLNLVFTRDELKAATRKVDALVQSEPYGAAVAETIAEIEGAIAATIVIVAAAASYSS